MVTASCAAVAVAAPPFVVAKGNETTNERAKEGDIKLRDSYAGFRKGIPPSLPR